MDVPLVTIIVEDEWNCIADATAKFKTAPNFSRSSWDWIGLYKVKENVSIILCSSVNRCQESFAHNRWVFEVAVEMSVVPRLFEWSAVGKSSAVPQVGFKHHKDYVGYVWAKQEEADYLRLEHQVTWTWEAEPSRGIVFSSPSPFHWFRRVVFQVTFTEEELPKGSGDFILGYYSNNMSTVVGVTEPFQVIIPRFMCRHCEFSLTLHRSSPTHSRSSSPLWVLTTALQTAPTSAPRTTAPLSWWRRAPRVPAHAGANTAPTTAVAAPAARSRPRSKQPAGLPTMLLQQTHRRGSLRVAHQRAAAFRPLTLRQKLKNRRLKNQGRDAKSKSVLCVTGHIKPTVVSLVQCIHSNVCFLRGKDTFYNAILFRNSLWFVQEALLWLCLQLFYWSVQIIFIYFYL